MFRTYRIGTLLGFPIEVNLSFLLLLGVFLLWLGPVTGVLFVGLAFGSVLLHELGHALVARHLRVPVAGIELHFFGGAAKMTRQPDSAGDEIAIAAAGPAVSFALGGVFLALAGLAGTSALGSFASLAGWINLVMALFNLVPALPMDGGRIFRALLTKRLGFMGATELSITVARVFAVALGVFGLVTLQVYLVLLAIMLWSMGNSELNVARHYSSHYSSRYAPSRQPAQPHHGRGWQGQPRREYRGHRADLPPVELMPRGFVIRRVDPRRWRRGPK